MLFPFQSSIGSADSPGMRCASRYPGPVGRGNRDGLGQHHAGAEQSNVVSLAAQSVDFSAGEIIFREGDLGTEMYIISEGKVEILNRLGEDDRVLAVLEKGDFFGEMSVLEDLPRAATARPVRGLPHPRCGVPIGHSNRRPTLCSWP